MKVFFHSRSFYIAAALAVIVGVIVMLVIATGRGGENLITATVETGTVQELVSVSGIAEAEQTAELAFPVTGIVREVLVEIGDQVEVGTELVSLEADALYADRQDALASIARARADRDEMLSGLTDSAKQVLIAQIKTQEEVFLGTIETQMKTVENTYKTMLSSDLEARSEDSGEEAVAPTVTGSYSCGEEGSYYIDVFSSNSDSGYSYRYSGLETGTTEAAEDQSSPMGNCGLRLQFDSGSNYNNSVWIIDIPNINSSSYVTNRNAYSLAQTQSETAVNAAQQALNLVIAEVKDSNAPARDEAIARANAGVTQAEAGLARIDATIADRALRAPFAGTITEIDILPGETVTTQPVVTLLADSEFEITARIPEIDIGKLLIGQKVNMLFDAKNDEILTGAIRFISLKSTKIDGVSYYEAIIDIDELPTWIRSGLNADIEIVIAEQENVLRVPKRFVSKEDESTFVYVLKDDIASMTPVTVTLTGNDGFVAITGINEGDIVMAP